MLVLNIMASAFADPPSPPPRSTSQSAPILALETSRKFAEDQTSSPSIKIQPSCLSMIPISPNMNLSDAIPKVLMDEPCHGNRTNSTVILLLLKPASLLVKTKAMLSLVLSMVPNVGAVLFLATVLSH
jgi:hypothetical protein